MATIVGGATVLVTSANATTYTASSDYTVIGGSDHVLVVLGALSQAATTPDDDVTVTAEGVSMTPAIRQAHTSNAGDPYCGIWYLTNPSAGATTVVATMASTGRGAVLRCVEIEGVDTADLLGTIVNRQGTNNTTIDTTIVPEAAGNIVLSIMGAQGGAAPFDPSGGSASEIEDTESGTNATGDVSAWVGSYDTVGTSSVNVGADGDTSGTGNFLAVEFRAAASGVSGSGAATITAVTASGTAERSVLGSGSPSITAVTTNATAENSVTGSGAATTPSTTASGPASRVITAIGASQFGGNYSVSGVAERVVTSSGSVNTPASTSSGSSLRTLTSSGSPSITSVTSQGTITGQTTGEGSSVLTPITASGTALRTLTSNGGFSIDVVFSGSASGQVDVSGGFTLGSIITTGVAERIITSSGACIIGGVRSSGSTTPPASYRPRQRGLIKRISLGI